MSANIRHSSESVEHYTPVAYVEAARKVMGSIDLDPASCDFANAVVQAKRIYTAKTLGHNKAWRGNVLLNPPGGRINGNWEPVKAGGESSAKAWWFKLVSEWTNGGVDRAIFIGFSLEMLQTSQVDTPSTAGGDLLALPLDFALCFPSRRIAYDINHEMSRKKGASPPHASFIAFLPNNVKENLTFKKEFSKFGRVIIPWG